ncbi:hypothetical protein NLI96_g4957 [Meripilus lineatus]|uniref:Cleavage stimulation factor subunit 2 hinge domain-containing protein n=1 Tax=Meripilus lineatus TaxID=2056292 RepID=A0AAD5V471_9APHY|nr:hypothetical protein NLI96_g4957 [Physisporinus lineatus]
MSAQTHQEDQLIDLLLQLKKTTPEQAKSILNAQPQIAYALMSVMVNLNAVNVEVIQNILSNYGSPQAQQLSQNVSQPPAGPSRVQSQAPSRGPTPASASQGPSFASHAYPSSTAVQSLGGPQTSQPPGLGSVVPPNKPAAPPIPDALAAIPGEQKVYSVHTRVY